MTTTESPEEPYVPIFEFSIKHTFEEKLRNRWWLFFDLLLTKNLDPIQNKVNNANVWPLFTGEKFDLGADGT